MRKTALTLTAAAALYALMPVVGFHALALTVLSFAGIATAIAWRRM